MIEKAHPKHTDDCDEWCNHCKVCGDGIHYGELCPTHYNRHCPCGKTIAYNETACEVHKAGLTNEKA